MGARVRWRQALAAVLGAVAVGSALVGGVQAVGGAGPGGAPDRPAGTGAPVPVGRPELPGASDPDAVAPPLGAGTRPPRFAPSAVVPVPLAPPGPESRSGSGSTADPPGPAAEPRSAPPPRPAAPSRRPTGGRTHQPTSGESQYEYGCRRGYITQGC